MIGATSFMLTKRDMYDNDREVKADIVEVARHAKSVQEKYKVTPDFRPSFRDCDRFFISNMGDSVVILRWGLTDSYGKNFTDNWGFTTIEYWRRQGDGEWYCSELDHLMPVDWASDVVEAVKYETKMDIEKILFTSALKGVQKAVETGIKRGINDATKTLEDIQTETAALEKRLKQLNELESKAATREAIKGQRKPRSLAGYVYVIKSLHPEPLYKIGRSNRPDKRTELFGIEVPFDIETVCLIQTDDMYALERELHAKFASNRVRGEWFNLTDSDLVLINQYSASAQTGDGESEAQP